MFMGHESWPSKSSNNSTFSIKNVPRKVLVIIYKLYHASTYAQADIEGF